MLIGVFFSVTVTAVYVAFLRSLYDQYLSFMTLSAVSAWPELAQIVLAVFVSDFVFWFHHYIRHKVPWFWEFHAVHHAQTELNLFTDERYHFVEYVIENTFNVLILSAAGVSPVNIVYFQVFRSWYTRLYHSNVRTNYGFLKYVLVTPQSHRVHHSIERRHVDKNFGVFFSFWDRLFGTQYRGYEEYPDTGITDRAFPHATSAAGLNLIHDAVSPDRLSVSEDRQQSVFRQEMSRKTSRRHQTPSMRCTTRRTWPGSGRLSDAR